MQNDLWTWDLYLTCYNLREILSVYRCMDHFKIHYVTGYVAT